MATAFFRTVILYLLLIAGLRITGKRQIGELEPIELVLTMLLSDLASVPMQDFGIPLVNGIVPIVTLLSLSMLLSYGSLRSVRFRTLLCGEPTLIIRSGHILQDAMRRNRLTVDELLEALRGQGISDLQEVKYAVRPATGGLPAGDAPAVVSPAGGSTDPAHRGHQRRPPAAPQHGAAGAGRWVASGPASGRRGPVTP